MGGGGCGSFRRGTGTCCGKRKAALFLGQKRRVSRGGGLDQPGSCLSIFYCDRHQERDVFGRDAADGDEVAKGDLTAASYPELALRTPLTRNEPDRAGYLGEAPCAESAQPGIYGKVHYSRQRDIDDANRHVYWVAELHSRTRPFIARPRSHGTPRRPRCGQVGRGGTLRPTRAH